MRSEERCPNRNHGRVDAPVRFCPMCGGVVNGDMPPKTCDDDQHARSRRNHNKFCVDCGDQLIQDR